jgi:hypothetical protein
MTGKGVDDVGGMPSKGTAKDSRLKENKKGTAKPKGGKKKGK